MTFRFCSSSADRCRKVKKNLRRYQSYPDDQLHGSARESQLHPLHSQRHLILDDSSNVRGSEQLILHVRYYAHFHRTIPTL